MSAVRSLSGGKRTRSGHCGIYAIDWRTYVGDMMGRTHLLIGLAEPFAVHPAGPAISGTQWLMATGSAC